MNPRTLYLLKRVEIEMTNRMSRALEAYDLTPIQFTVLYFVDFDKGDLSSAQLSRRFLMTPQSMNELVRLLEKKELLRKNVDPSHKRILRLSLTEKGVEVLKQCNETMDRLENSLLEGFEGEDLNSLRCLLGKILDSARKQTFDGQTENR